MASATTLSKDKEYKCLLLNFWPVSALNKF